MGLLDSTLHLFKFDSIGTLFCSVSNHKQDWSQNELEGNSVSSVRRSSWCGWSKFFFGR